MTEIDLDAMRVRAEQARRGPWAHRDDLDGQGYPGHHWIVETADAAPGDEDFIATISVGTQGDAEFIAHAREDVPALLALVRQQQELLDDARRERDDWQTAARGWEARAARAEIERDEARDEVAQLQDTVVARMAAMLHALGLEGGTWLEIAAAASRLRADRDRAREVAVALEQQLAEVERLAYEGGQDAETVRRRILGVFEAATPKGAYDDETAMRAIIFEAARRVEAGEDQ